MFEIHLGVPVDTGDSPQCPFLSGSVHLSHMGKSSECYQEPRCPHLSFRPEPLGVVEKSPPEM